MRNVIKTHTGTVISDEDLSLEYVCVGDYGKENNVKADFLGYKNKINKVEHKDVNINDKLVLLISSQKGCPMSCNFCDCPKFGFHGNATCVELLSEITTGVALSGIKHGKRLNLHFARMGEPTFNENVIEAAIKTAQIFNGTFDEYHPVVATMCPKNNKNLFSFLDSWCKAGSIYGGDMGFGIQFSINTLDEDKRNEAFNNESLSLKEIGELISKLPHPGKRKYTLNFAVTPESNLDVNLMNKYFDKDRCVIKITPMHRTYEAMKSGYEVIDGYDGYEKFERPLVEDGWDVIVALISEEEDSDRITCGNSFIAKKFESKK